MQKAGQVLAVDFIESAIKKVIAFFTLLNFDVVDEFQLPERA